MDKPISSLMEKQDDAVGIRRNDGVVADVVADPIGGIVEVTNHRP